ncbi:hypothetical protein [Microbacterium sp. 2RAF4]|uniref:hypothetical protein n=1 Tax=Microbacterium sp. 2RAF4 TaxID=3232999 RepID=UPI003F96F5D0
MTIHSEGINPTDNEKMQEIQDASDMHDCEFECASDEEHLKLAYDTLRSEYEGYRQWVRIAFTHNIAEADAKKIASRYVWHMTPSGGGLRNSAKAMQAALSEFIKLRVEAAHAAQAAGVVGQEGEKR